MKDKLKNTDESRWVIVMWKMIKKGLLHNFHSDYCNGKVFTEDMLDDDSR